MRPLPWPVVVASVVGLSAAGGFGGLASAAEAGPSTSNEAVVEAEDALGTDADSLEGAPAWSPEDVAQLQSRVAELEARLQRVEGKPVAPPHPGVGTDLIVPRDAHWSEAVAWSGDVTVHGSVSGPVVAVGGDIWVGPEARVEGHLLSLGGEIDVHPDAIVLGDRVGLHHPPQPAGWLETLSRRLAMILGVGAMVVLGVNLTEDRTRNIADTIRQAPGWYTVGGGVLTLAAVIAGTAALISVVAAPLGLALLVGLGLTWAVGVAGVCRWVGDSLPGPPRRPWVSALLGALVVGGVCALPGLGPIVAVGAGLAAVGAGTVSRLGRRTVLDI